MTFKTTKQKKLYLGQKTKVASHSSEKANFTFLNSILGYDIAVR